MQCLQNVNNWKIAIRSEKNVNTRSSYGSYFVDSYCNIIDYNVQQACMRALKQIRIRRWMDEFRIMCSINLVSLSLVEMENRRCGFGCVDG